MGKRLCREWTLAQARAGQLPFPPEIVGSHWATDAQVDVVALNWREKAILLGECKWGVDAVGRSVVRELVDKVPRVVPGDDWQVHYVFFARAGFTDAARTEADSVGARLVDLETLDADLRGALTGVQVGDCQGDRRRRVEEYGRRRNLWHLGGSMPGLRLVMGYYNLCLPHQSLREALLKPIPTKGNGSPKKWIPRTPGTLVPALQVQVWLQVSRTMCGRWVSSCCSEYHPGDRR